MATQKQIDANRINGKKGGPKTPAGRAAVRFNAFKHGMFAEHPVLLTGEEEEGFNFYHQALLDEFEPVGVMEHLLLDELAHAHWRRQRIVSLERGFFALSLADLKIQMESEYNQMGESARKHYLVRHDARDKNTLGHYYRYDARFERSFYKAYKELTSLQAARHAREAEEAEIEEAPETKVTKGLHQESLHLAEQTQFPAKPKEPAGKIDPETPENGDDDTSIM